MTDSFTILGLTDLHSNGDIKEQALKALLEKEAVDLILVAGDITTYGRRKKIQKILAKIDALGKRVFYVPGNMDSADSTDISFSNTEPLHGKAAAFNGVYFIGIGGSNKTPFSCPFTLAEDEISNLLIQAKKSAPKEAPLFLVSHAPPFESEADIVSGGSHVGSKAVKNFVETAKPLAVLCGHIHESKSVASLGSTLCVNPGEFRQGNVAIIQCLHESGKITVKARLEKI